MRILFIHGDRREPGQGGGAESLLRDQSKALKLLGHESAWWYGEGSLESAIEQFKPDVCHLMTIHCYPMGMEPAIYLQEHKIPHVWHLQDYWPFCGGRMLLKNHDESCCAVTGRCDCQCEHVPAPDPYQEIVNHSFVVAGNANTAEIYRRNGLRCDAVVELGIDTELFQPDESRRDGMLNIYTSTAWPTHPVKGMHVLKAAISGSVYSVKLLSGLPRETVAAELKQANIYVFPSCYEETWGLCLTEAMASGCACIASDVAGARAQIERGVTGLLVPKRDPDALRAALELLLSDGELRSRLGEAARAHVAKDHSLEAMGQRWETVYEEVLNGSTNRHGKSDTAVASVS
jgi:glycosyltransferase involved in cell wall biosynthesis